MLCTDFITLGALVNISMHVMSLQLLSSYDITVSNSRSAENGLFYSILQCSYFQLGHYWLWFTERETEIISSISYWSLRREHCATGMATSMLPCRITSIAVFLPTLFEELARPDTAWTITKVSV